MLKTIRVLAWAAVALLVVAIVGTLAYQSFYGGSDRSMIADTKMGAPFRLVDHNGDPITEEAIEGQPAAVFFGFTHCPEVCPTTLYELAGWLDQLGEDGENIQAFFISVDPERDTPEAMKSYVENFTDRITGITGDPKEIHELEKAWRVYAKKVPLEDGDYTMDHTASVMLVDSEGRFKGTIAYGESSDTALEKLRRLAKG
ncbi:SCO family protein [Notoacmeibacter ruber]|uniref:SCO family protein n=1 Tax=Notoacmeibacter ruber TaxID=2670375 RepID=A0A3L7J8C2_9HYPH|nr:SCO family protein [Notoacmeibacter ruber]